MVAAIETAKYPAGYPTPCANQNWPIAAPFVPLTEIEFVDVVAGLFPKEPRQVHISLMEEVHHQALSGLGETVGAIGL
jgi:hypothetical protein